MRWRVLARRERRAAAAPATLPKPHKSGRGRDNDPPRDIVRRRASYGTTRAAAETYRVEVEKPEIFISSPRALHRASPALPKCFPRAADASGSKADLWWGEHP